MAMRLQSQFSEQSPTKIKKKGPSLHINEQPMAEDAEDVSLLEDYCPICYATQIVTGDEPLDA